jgi:copper oxidase (laccase) domain-containing protein
MTTATIGSWNIFNGPLWESPVHVILPRQVHGATIIEVKEYTIEQRRADGIVTAQNDIAIGVLTADCLPLVLIQPQKAVALHVSRKTLIKGLLDRAEKYMEPSEIIGGYIGPHICENDFLFPGRGPEIKRFQQLFPRAVSQTPVGIHLSLRRALDPYFKKWGVKATNLIEDGRCTYEDPALYSYRRWPEQNLAFALPRLATITWRE